MGFIIMVLFAVAVGLSSTYKKFMFGHIASTTSTMEGECHHIVTSVELIVVEICLKVRQRQLIFLFFMLSVFKNGFCHTTVLCYIENSVCKSGAAKRDHSHILHRRL